MNQLKQMFDSVTSQYSNDASYMDSHWGDGRRIYHKGSPALRYSRFMDTQPIAKRAAQHLRETILTDGTFDYLRRHIDIEAHTIPPDSEFLNKGRPKVEVYITQPT